MDTRSSAARLMRVRDGVRGRCLDRGVSGAASIDAITTCLHHVGTGQPEAQAGGG